MAETQVVIFSALYMPHLGGVEKFSQSIAAELSKNSHVTVFCMNTENQPPYVKDGNVEVYFLPCFPLQKGRFPVPKLSSLRILRNWFAQNHVDFGIVQCRFYLLSWLGCRILAKHNIRFIQIEHGAGDVVMPNPVVNWIWHLYDRLLTRWEKKIPHDVYAVSNAGLDWLRNYGIEGKGVISNSIAPKDFEAALSQQGNWRKKHQIPDGAVVITFTGRIMKDKGVLDLLEAFDHLRGNELYLVIAGTGDMNIVSPWRDRENILFPGQLPFEEIPYLLVDSDIFCLPSHFVEGKPTGVLEAGFCRNAVVASNSGGTTEIIPEEKYGLLVPTGDIGVLTAAIQRLVDNSEMRAEMGESLRLRVEEFFTWKTAAGEIERIMRA